MIKELGDVLLCKSYSLFPQAYWVAVDVGCPARSSNNKYKASVKLDDSYLQPQGYNIWADDDDANCYFYTLYDHDSPE